MMGKKHILPVIVLAQFCCTSLWFASNAIMQDLVVAFGLPETATGILTSAVQLGFISGTLLFAILTITDRYAPSKVFFYCALLGSLSNLALIWEAHGLTSLLVARYATGFFLAGIYPVGMKIAADYYDKGLGTSLGYLVGALVLGTSFPHYLKNFEEALPWTWVVMITSLIAALGGILLWSTVPNGPYRKPSQSLHWDAFITVFRKPSFRQAAFGYFGHMWELYAFWAFVPFIIIAFNQLHAVQISVPIWCFITIGIGSLSCVASGYISMKIGAKNTATYALLASAICCLLLPVVVLLGNVLVFLVFLIFWGMVVIADSPMFSTLVAKNAIPEFKGTALTIVNCIGFAITIASIQLLTFLITKTDSIAIYTVLVVGPIFGLYHLFLGKSQ